MLVLSRQPKESIVIMLSELVPLIEAEPQKLATILSQPFTVTAIEVRGDKVRLGIDASIQIPVHRLEVYEAIQRERAI